MATSPAQITKLLGEMRDGNPTAMEKLMPLVYAELHRLAASHMRRERPGHTLQPTALVNEAYLRLIEQRNMDWKSRAHFFGVASGLMRRILVDHARKSHAAKRGGGIPIVALDEALLAGEARSETLLALEEALTRLEAMDAQQARLVELRFFGGLSGEEAAEALRISARTADREWKIAQAWLRRQLQTRGEPV